MRDKRGINPAYGDFVRIRLLIFPPFVSYFSPTDVIKNESKRARANIITTATTPAPRGSSRRPHAYTYIYVRSRNLPTGRIFPAFNVTAVHSTETSFTRQSTFPRTIRITITSALNRPPPPPSPSTHRTLGKHVTVAVRNLRNSPSLITEFAPPVYRIINNSCLINGSKIARPIIPLKRYNHTARIQINFRR